MNAMIKKMVNLRGFIVYVIFIIIYNILYIWKKFYRIPRINIYDIISLCQYNLLVTHRVDDLLVTHRVICLINLYVAFKILLKK